MALKFKNIKFCYKQFKKELSMTESYDNQKLFSSSQHTIKTTKFSATCLLPAVNVRNDACPIPDDLTQCV